MDIGIVQMKDFFYTVPINGYFFGREKLLSVFQILFVSNYVIFAIDYISKIVEHRLRFITASYWNLYDLGLLTLITVSFYFDSQFVMSISPALKSLAVMKKDAFKDLIHFIDIQLHRIELQAYVLAAVIIRLLRFLPHFSHVIGTLLDVLYRSIRNSIGFLFLFAIIFMSFVFFATFHYGIELYEVRSL